MPQRLGLRAWLEQQIDSGKYKGVQWIDKSKGQFVVPWKHASRHGWQDEDAALFKAWAVYTRRFQEERGDKESPKTWKANFRCAVNALPDIKSVKGSNKKGKNACRVFEFSKKRKSRETVCQRQVPVKINECEKMEKGEKLKMTDDNNQSSYNTRRKGRTSTLDIKREPEEISTCMRVDHTRTTIKQECNKILKEPKYENDDHCYPKFEPPRPCFKEILDISNLSLLPQGYEINQAHWFQSHLQANYSYQNYRQQYSYHQEINPCIPEPPNASELPDLQTVLEVAQCIFNDTTNAAEYMCDELPPSDNEEFMESCRPGSVGSAALSDAELEEILMPKEEVIDNEYEFEHGNDYNYIYNSDPFLSEKEPRDDILQIKAITQALKHSSEFH